MVFCDISANLLGAAGRYRSPRIPLPLRCANSRLYSPFGVRLWGMKCKARRRTTQSRTQRRKRHTLRRAIERRSSLRRYPKAAPAEGDTHGIGMASADRAVPRPLASTPRGTQGPRPLRGLLVTFPAAEKSLRAGARKLSKTARGAKFSGRKVTAPARKTCPSAPPRSDQSASSATP